MRNKIYGVSNPPIRYNGCRIIKTVLIPCIYNTVKSNSVILFYPVVIKSAFINFDKVEAYKDFGGIRNEENFVITSEGYKLLGKNKPKTIEEVEAQKNL